MSGVTQPKGALPAGVYWRRRAAVLAMLAAMLFGLVSVVSNIAGDSDPKDSARLTAGEPTQSEAPQSVVQPTEKPEPEVSPTKKKPSLPEPTGTCAESDIQVTPIMKRTVAGQDIRFVLQLKTRLSIACAWQVSAQSLIMKFTSGNDDIWTSTDCPRSIPRQDLVLRRDTVAKVALIWSGKRSGESCVRGERWALPGYYHLHVAAFGGEPTDLQFELTAPEPGTVVKTVSPKPEKKG